MKKNKFKDKIALEVLKILIPSQLDRATMKSESDNLKEITDTCYMYAESMCESKAKDMISKKSNGVTND